MWLDNFNEMRRQSGLSLDELSEKSGVPKGTLSKISAGITEKTRFGNNARFGICNGLYS